MKNKGKVPHFIKAFIGVCIVLTLKKIKEYYRYAGNYEGEEAVRRLRAFTSVSGHSVEVGGSQISEFRWRYAGRLPG